MVDIKNGMNVTFDIVVACGHLSDDEVLVLPFDVTNIASHRTATEAVLKTFGQVSVFVFLTFVQHSLFELQSLLCFFVSQHRCNK